MNEINVLINLQVNSHGLQWAQGRPTFYQANMQSNQYPYPGAVYAQPVSGGTNVDLSFFDDNGIVPGLVWMRNLDTYNYVEYGIYDYEVGPGTHAQFFPIGLLTPGMICVWYMSSSLRTGGLEFRLRALDPSSTPGHWVAAGNPVQTAVAIFGV